jgi:hypothetical protein
MHYHGSVQSLSNISRLSYGVSARLPRIAPYNALKFRDWTIPPGVCILTSLMTSTDRHRPP